MSDRCRILVVSDTHGRDEKLKKLVKTERFDMLIHCGDVECDIYRSLGGDVPYPVYAVDGNCDYRRYPEEITVDCCGHRILVVHGHNHSVRYSNERLYAAAAARSADVVLFGHTHVPELEEHNGIFLMNPGSLSFPRGRSRRASYGILELAEGEYPMTRLFEIR